MLGQRRGEALQESVAELGAQAQAFAQGIEAGLPGKGLGYPLRTATLDKQEQILAVGATELIGRAVHVLAGNRQRGEIDQDVPADGFQVSRSIGTDVEHPGIAIGGKGIQAQGEHGELARRARASYSRRGSAL